MTNRVLARATGTVPGSPPPVERGKRVAARGALSIVAVTVLAAPTAWFGYRAADPWTGVENLDVEANPGALTVVEPGRWLPDPEAPLVPSTLDAAVDWPLWGRDDCAVANLEDPEVLTCALGDPDGERSVALVGGSHSFNFALAVEAVAKESGTRVDGYFKASCPLQLRDPEPDDEAWQATCATWNEEVLERIAASDNVAVITTGSRPAPEGVDIDGDYVPDSYVAAWQKLVSQGIPVLAIRDNPWFTFDVPECVEREGPLSEACWEDRAERLGEDPFLESFADDLFTTIDLSHAFCDELYCYPVTGNVLMYIDSNHVTGTYQRTMGPLLAAALEGVDWW